MESIYIAGPMTGYENYNFAAFDLAKARLSNIFSVEGIKSPADMDRELGLEPDENGDIENFDYHAAIKRCCDSVFECDAIYMLTGWENSKGARAEHAIAVALDMEIIYE
jgi:hypothetical protein